jgi:hypothetical protein
MDEQGGFEGEAKSLVDGDGVAIGAEDVQEAVFAGFGMDVKQMGDELGRVAFAAVRRVGADSADLMGVSQSDAFTGHGDEITCNVDAEESAELRRSGQKEAGKGYIRQGDHVAKILSRQRSEVLLGAGREIFAWVVHAEQRELPDMGEAKRGDVWQWAAGEIDELIGVQELAQGCQ